MPSQEESRETGRAFMVVGWILVLFALLVMFFEPAALRLGQMRFGAHRRRTGGGRVAAEHLRLSLTAAQLLSKQDGPSKGGRVNKPVCHKSRD